MIPTLTLNKQHLKQAHDGWSLNNNIITLKLQHKLKYKLQAFYYMALKVKTWKLPIFKKKGWSLT